MARKTYTREFKLQAVRVMADPGLSVPEVGRCLGIREDLLPNWKKATFPGPGHPAPADDEHRRLRAEVARLRAERDLLKSRRLLRQPAGLTFRLLAAHAGMWPVAWMCDALDVSEPGYHAGAARTPSRAERRRDELVAAIRAIHAEVRGRYGSPRMAAALNARGHPCSENTVARLMRAHGVRAKAPRRSARTTDARHGLPVAANVLGRRFGPPGPNAAWSADIACVPTADGWLYLAVVVGPVQPDGRRAGEGRSDDQPARRRRLGDGGPPAGSRGRLDRTLRPGQPGRQRSPPPCAGPARNVCSMSRAAQRWDTSIW